MSNYNEAFPSKYLKSSDLGGKETTVRVLHIQPEEMDNNGKKENKLVAYFEKKEKGIVLNKTNAETLAFLSGSEETDDWGGIDVTIYTVDTTDRQGRPTKGLRLKAAKRQQQANKQFRQPETTGSQQQRVATPLPAQAAPVDMDAEEIPF